MMTHAEDRVDSRIGGVPISIRGLNMVVFLSFLAITSFTIWFLAIRISEDHRAIADLIEEQNYILLADEKEAQDIKGRYKMPRSLREKLKPRD